MVTAWTTSLGFQPTLVSGDPLLALMQAVSAQLVFIQAQIQLVNAVARAQTSAGTDLDTFYGQFNFTRLPGTMPTGNEVFTKLTPAVGDVLIPAGTIVQTPGGAIQYQVVADSAQPTWSSSQDAYILRPGETSLTATVQALVSGSAQNVAAGQLTQIASSLSGIDEATNPNPISNGVDPESDSAFSARFVLYLNSLSKAIEAAIVETIVSTQQGLSYLLIENENFYGSPYAFYDDQTYLDGGLPYRPGPSFPPQLIIQPGIFLVVVDDGSGNPPDSLILALQQAVNAVRGFTIQYRVMGPTVIKANVSMTLTVAGTAVRQDVIGAVATALETFLDALPLGTLLVPRTRLAQVAYDASASVLNVTGITINGQRVDLSLTKLQVCKAGAVAVN